MPPTASGNASLDGQTIMLRLHGGRAHAWCEALGLHASAPDAATAVADLERQLADRRRFAAESGLAVAGAALPALSPVHRGRLARWALLLIGTGLIAFQLSYAVSAGLARGLDRAFSAEWRDGLLLSLERQLAAAADPRQEPAAESRERLVAAVRALKARYGPVWDEIVRERAPERRP